MRVENSEWYAALRKRRRLIGGRVPKVQIQQTQPPVFRMLAQPEPGRQRHLPSGVTQARRGRHHRNREKGIPQAGRNGMPLDALHPRARQPTHQGLYG